MKFYQFGSQGIQMDIAHQFREIVVLLAERGFKPVLKRVFVTAMASVVARSVSGQETPHNREDGNAASAQQ